MKKFVLLVMIALLLSGCSGKQTFETVDDELVQPAVAQQRQILLQLPEETLLTRYRDTRSLMAHVDELTKRLPDTEMNRRILKALAMLNRDRLLSQQRTPCAFLEELVEKSDGLFVDPYPKSSLFAKSIVVLKCHRTVQSHKHFLWYNECIIHTGEAVL